MSYRESPKKSAGEKLSFFFCNSIISCFDAGLPKMPSSKKWSIYFSLNK